MFFDFSGPLIPLFAILYLSPALLWVLFGWFGISDPILCHFISSTCSFVGIFWLVWHFGSLFVPFYIFYLLFCGYFLAGSAFRIPFCAILYLLPALLWVLFGWFGISDPFCAILYLLPALLWVFFGWFSISDPFLCHLTSSRLSEPESR